MREKENTPLLIAEGDIPTTRVLAKTLEEAFGGVELALLSSNMMGIDVTGRPLLLSRVSSPGYGWLPDYFTEKRAPYCYFLDDNFWAITDEVDPALSPTFQHPSTRKTLLDFISKAKTTIVMSHYLGKYIRSKCPEANVRYVPPGFDFIKIEKLRKTVLPVQRGKNEIRIGYPTSRRFNIEPLLIPVVNEITRLYRGRVSFEFVGWMPQALAGKEGVILYPHMGDYDAYLKFKLSRDWDIGIAPVLDGVFESCKTQVKYREYGGCHVPGIYSRVPLYLDDIKHGETGWLVENTVGAWIEGLIRLIEDQTLRQRLADQAFHDVFSRFSQKESAIHLKSAMTK